LAGDSVKPGPDFRHGRACLGYDGRIAASEAVADAHLTQPYARELFPPPGVVLPGGLQGATMPISRNFLFLIVGALVVAVGALSWKIYEDHKEPKGVQLNIGPAGISVEKK
jgi:hypothetical protein